MVVPRVEKNLYISTMSKVAIHMPTTALIDVPPEVWPLLELTFYPFFVLHSRSYPEYIGKTLIVTGIYVVFS